MVHYSLYILYLQTIVNHTIWSILYCPFLYMVACTRLHGNILMGLEFCLQSRPPVPLQIQTEGRHVLAMAHFGILR